MKANRILFLSLSIIVLLSLVACTNNTPQQEVSSALGIDTLNAAVVTDIDTHGGFHGDGTAYIELSFTDDTCLESIKESSSWKQLPLSDNLTTLVYGKNEGNTRNGPYLTNDSTSEKLFPNIQNGYYYFLDRHSESKNPQDDSGVLDRHSYNFTIAIYDIDTNTLHYCKFDT